MNIVNKICAFIIGVIITFSGAIIADGIGGSISNPPQYPIAVNKGGTGATTAGAARTALGVPSIAGDTFTGNVIISPSANAKLNLINSGATTNNRGWGLYTSGGLLSLGVCTDSGGVCASGVDVQRNNNGVAYVDLHSDGVNAGLVIDADATTDITLNSGNDLGLSGSIRSTKACVTGFSRLTPNFCINELIYGDAFVFTSLTRDACTDIAGNVPSNSVIVFDFQVIARSNNGVATRNAVVTQHYSSSSCAYGNAYDLALISIREFSATAAGTTISSINVPGVTAHSFNSNMYVVFTDDAGNQGAAGYRIVGYYD